MLHRLPNHLSALRKARKDEGGFTLIELLIVIVILGVLAGIVVFSVRGITDRGDEAACKANLKTVEIAVEAYYAKNGSIPGHAWPPSSADFLKSDPSVAPSTPTARRRYDAVTGAVTARQRLLTAADLTHGGPSPAAATLLRLLEGEPCTSTCTASATGSTCCSTPSGRRSGTDLLLTAGLPPLIRVDGDAAPGAGRSPCSRRTTPTPCWPRCSPPTRSTRWDTEPRVRLLLLLARARPDPRQRLHPARADRGGAADDPARDPDASTTLGLPPVAAATCRCRHQGLVLVTGPTGSRQVDDARRR